MMKNVICRPQPHRLTTPLGNTTTTLVGTLTQLHLTDTGVTQVSSESPNGTLVGVGNKARQGVLGLMPQRTQRGRGGRRP